MMKHTCLTGLLLALLISPALVVAQEGEPFQFLQNQIDDLQQQINNLRLKMPLYDDFDSFIIDQSKWSFGISPEPACFIGVLEQRALITELTSVGQNVACWLKFSNPAVITGWSTDVTVTKYMHTFGRSDARIFGLFFRASLHDRETGSLIGTADIHGQVRVRNVEPVGFAQWLIFFCEDPIFCSFGKVLSVGTLGDVRLNETRNIAMDWDGQTTFTFKLSGVPSATVNLANLAQFGVTNIGPPSQPNKAVGSRATSNPIGEMTAIYDNVRCHTADGSPCPLF